MNAAPDACSEDVEPVADAGSDIATRAGDPLLLNGSPSFDPDGGKPGPLRFAWMQVEGPEVVLRSPSSPRPSFVPTLPGTYRFSLTVSDGLHQSVPDTVAIDIRPAPAEAKEPTLTVFQGDIACSAANGRSSSNRGSAWLWGALASAFGLIVRRVSRRDERG